MVAKIGNEITDVPLSEVAGRLRLVTPDNDLGGAGQSDGNFVWNV